MQSRKDSFDRHGQGGVVLLELAGRVHTVESGGRHSDGIDQYSGAGTAGTAVHGSCSGGGGGTPWCWCSVVVLWLPTGVLTLLLKC